MALEYLILAVVVLVSSILYYYLHIKGTPPGPWGLPVFGYLLFLNKKKPYETLAKIAWEYGPVCSLKMGSVFTVLISQPDIVRKVFAKDEFSYRAPLYITHGIMKGYGLIAAEGILWKEHRRFTIQSLKNLGMLKNASQSRDVLEAKIVEFAEEAVQKIRKSTRYQQPLDPHNILHHCIGNFMNYLVFGVSYNEHDREWQWLQRIQEEGIKHIGVAGPLNFLPILRWVPSFTEPINRIIEGQRKTHEIYEERYNKYVENEIKWGENPREHNSILAHYVQRMRDQALRGYSPEHLFEETQMYYYLADIYGAGVDTTLTTLRWFLLFMAAFPTEQEKIYDEMTEVLGNKMPILSDRPKLLRLQAAIMETQRLRSVVPTGIPHGTKKATTIEGYKIPKNAMIMPLQWAMHMNSRFWAAPQTFMPDRFLDDAGGFLRHSHFMPFQAGNRICPGIELAQMMLFTFAARILKRFELCAPESQTLDLEGEAGITLMPKEQPLIFKFRQARVYVRTAR